MNLPAEVFPDRSDETRVSFLFSEEAVDADTIAFWENALYAYSLHKTSAASLPSKGVKGPNADTISTSSITFTCANVIDDFTVHDIIPTSIFKCTEALNKKSSLMKVSELKSYSSSSSTSTTVWGESKSLLFSSSLWVINAVTNIVGSKESSDINSSDTNNSAAINEEYVSMKMLSEIESLLFTFIANEINDFECDDSNPHYVGSCYYKDYDPNISDRKFSFIGLLNTLIEKYESKSCVIDIASQHNDKLIEVVKAIKNSQENTLLLQNFMLRSKGAILSKDNSVIQIRIATSNVKSSSTSSSILIGEEEIAKLTIASSICLLEGKLRSVEAEIAAHERRAKQYVSDGNKTLAMQQLQLKKIKSESKDTLSSYLVSLVSSQQQLQSSAITAVVKDTILATTNGLRAVRLAASMSEDGAMDAMEDLAEEMEAMKDISTALTSSSVSGVEQSDDELLSELNDLMGSTSISTRETSGAAKMSGAAKEGSFDPSRVLSLLQKSEEAPAAVKAPEGATAKKMVAMI